MRAPMLAKRLNLSLASRSQGLAQSRTRRKSRGRSARHGQWAARGCTMGARTLRAERNIFRGERTYHSLSWTAAVSCTRRTCFGVARNGWTGCLLSKIEPMSERERRSSQSVTPLDTVLEHDTVHAWARLIDLQQLREGSFVYARGTHCRRQEQQGREPVHLLPFPCLASDPPTGREKTHPTSWLALRGLRWAG